MLLNFDSIKADFKYRRATLN